LDTDTLAKAAILTVIGMVVVFVGLIILMLAIMVLQKVASGKKTGVEIRQAVSKTGESEHPSKASIAAMAVGLAWLMEESEAASARGQEAMAPVHGAGEGPWTIAGREQQMRSRGKVVHQWGRPSKS
jgi:Na+-transporting methylmalonyl-CoA/oxaloacetate decarboxylase gamma subunit